MNTETPITPKELIGKEPSIIDLQNLIKTNENIFTNLDISAIEFYSNYNKESKTYYLAGQLLIKKEHPITEELINKAKELDKKRKEEYDGPCNFLEAQSIYRQDIMFGSLQKIIERYYEFMIHELYRPPDYSIIGDKGGEIYQYIEKTTMIGK
jgi:hypothetical protein